MSKKVWTWIGWALLTLGLLLNVKPWENGWGAAISILPYVIAFMVLMLGLTRLDKHFDKRGIGEARFDSETGKQLPPGDIA